MLQILWSQLFYLVVFCITAEVVTWRCSFKKGFVNILQSWWESVFARVSFVVVLLVGGLSNKIISINFENSSSFPHLLEFRKDFFINVIWPPSSPFLEEQNLFYLLMFLESVSSILVSLNKDLSSTFFNQRLHFINIIIALFTLGIIKVH